MLALDRAALTVLAHGVIPLRYSLRTQAGRAQCLPDHAVLWTQLGLSSPSWCMSYAFVAVLVQGHSALVQHCTGAPQGQTSLQCSVTALRRDCPAAWECSTCNRQALGVWDLLQASWKYHAENSKRDPMPWVAQESLDICAGIWYQCIKYGIYYGKLSPGKCLKN